MTALYVVPLTSSEHQVQLRRAVAASPTGHAVSNSAKCDDFAEPTGTAAVECSCRSNIQCEDCLLCSSPAASDRTTVPKSFKIHDRVSWNSEAGCVSGPVVRVRTRNFKVKGYTHHASTDVPQYEIKSAKTDHVAFHKGSALTKLGD